MRLQLPPPADAAIAAGTVTVAAVVAVIVAAAAATQFQFVNSVGCPEPCINLKSCLPDIGAHGSAALHILAPHISVTHQCHLGHPTPQRSTYLTPPFSVACGVSRCSAAPAWHTSASRIWSQSSSSLVLPLSVTCGTSRRSAARTWCRASGHRASPTWCYPSVSLAVHHVAAQHVLGAAHHRRPTVHQAASAMSMQERGPCLRRHRG